MKKFLFGCIFTFAACCLLIVGTAERSYGSSGLYKTAGCINCHGAAAQSMSCIGCHAMGVHACPVPGDFENKTLNLVARTNRAIYLPGEPVRVTIDGGNYGYGWARIALHDQNMTMVAKSGSTLVLPDATAPCCGPTWGDGHTITLAGPAPAADGTYTWSAGWYGNQYDASEHTGGRIPTSFGPRWTPDQNNPNHGWEFISTNTFVVSSVPTPVAPATLAFATFGNVASGSTSTVKSIKVSNAGNADLHLTSIALCGGTSSEFSWAPQAPLAVAPGAYQTVLVTYKPVNVGTDSGCLSITTDDPQRPTLSLNVSGNGTTPPPPPVDVDIVNFTVTPSVSLRSKTAIAIQLSVLNPGTTAGNATATVRGTLNGATVYVQALTVSDVIGDANATAYTFPSFMPTAKGPITWTAFINDTTADVDTVTATTAVSR